MKKFVLKICLFVLLSISVITLFGNIDNKVYAEEDSKNTNVTPKVGDAEESFSKNNRLVYLGGVPLGINVQYDGLMITGKQDVITENGTINPCKDIELIGGDIIYAIDGVRVFSEIDVVNALKGKNNVEISIKNCNGINKYRVKTAIDILSGNNKIGLMLKDGITGIGTLTFIDKESNRYGALGHPIEKDTSYRSGNVYNAYITSYISGKRGKPGELNGSIDGYKSVGTIDKNTDFGIYGKYYGDTNKLQTIEVASRDQIKNGKAYIYTTIDGNSPKKYEIEIIKRNNQPKEDTKSMVIRVTDKELLASTHGILQGMSGSPIIQNNRLIGAVTHVFINDPTKGYGLYADFMLDK